jgi:hypothetical protein
MATTRNELANLVGHLSSMRTQIEAVQRHLDEAHRLIFSMMKEQGLAEDPKGLTTPEERGT